MRVINISLGLRSLIEVFVVISLFLSLSFLLVIPSSANAQAADSGVNLTTSPLPINLSTVPGSPVSTELRVRNDAPVAQKLKLSLMKFKAYGEEGKPALIARQDGDDYFDWVTFSRTSFEARPGQWESVKMTISPPKSAAFGYYYAAVFSRDDNFTPVGKGNKLLGSTAVLVLLDVKSPNAKRSLEIVDFTANRKMYEFLPVSFTLRLRNNGNTHVIPHGNIFIKRGSKQVASLPLNAAQGNVLPGSNRVFSSQWTDGFPVYVAKEQDGRAVVGKDGQPIYKLNWDFTKAPKLKFGHYSANVLAVYDNGESDVPLEASLSFWVIPWRVIGIFLVIAILAGVGLWSTGRKIYTKIIKKPAKNAKKIVK